MDHVHHSFAALDAWVSAVIRYLSFLSSLSRVFAHLAQFMGFTSIFSNVGIGIDIMTITQSNPFFTIPIYLKCVPYLPPIYFFLMPGFGMTFSSHILFCTTFVPYSLTASTFSSALPGLDLGLSSLKSLCATVTFTGFCLSTALSISPNLFVSLCGFKSFVFCDHVYLCACATASPLIALPQ